MSSTAVLVLLVIVSMALIIGGLVMMQKSKYTYEKPKTIEPSKPKVKVKMTDSGYGSYSDDIPTVAPAGSEGMRDEEIYEDIPEDVNINIAADWENRDDIEYAPDNRGSSKLKGDLISAKSKLTGNKVREMKDGRWQCLYCETIVPAEDDSCFICGNRR